ncbi:MAG: esterase-like activity of phytase family protein, partial [Hyphomicrobiales bacterium]|nr:esterase-like activity of phytase family protein [Hyphomicrobiales bacterium]
MFARDHVASRSLPIFALALIAWLAPATATRGGETVTIGDLTFINQALVGVGRLPADLRDKFGETFGSGSAIAVDPKSWVRTPSGYQGTFYMLPDRGFNVAGTSDYRARINKLFITFKPLDDPAAVPVAERQNSVAATLTDTILLTDAAGQSLTGLDPVGIRRAANGFPDLPQASNGRVSIDSESLALLPDGGFFIGDEYGPYVYRFSPAGRLLAAIRPPEAFLPKRKGEDHFASNNPGPGAQAPDPPDPGNRPGEQPRFRRAHVDPAGRQIPRCCVAECDPPGRRHLAGNAAIFPPALLRRRRSRTPEARARVRRAASAVRERERGTAGRGPERAACA